MKHLRTRGRRIWPALVGTTALVAAILVATLGVGASTGGATPSTQLAASAAPARHADETANRGNGRTTDGLEASTTTTPLPVTTTTVAPTTTIPPTTTTVAPTTTTTAPKPTTTTTAAPAATNSQTGGASYYAQPWAAKGCAHKTLPKGTVVTVTNLANGKSTTCVINDRGPYVAGRIIDMDTTIFEKLASTSQGVFQARITW